MTLTVGQTDDVDACLAVRWVVFVEEQNVPVADELDGKDDEAVHVLARDGDKAVGAARILFHDDVAHVGRVAVLRSHRGTGLGAKIMAACIDLARENPDTRRVVLGAQVYALPFYERLGFTAFGPVYDDAGIEHRDMELRL